jgi:signal transduction histidine kinase
MSKYYRSVRFKITLGLLLSLVIILVAATVVEYIGFRRLLAERLEPAGVQEAVAPQLGAYLRWRLLLSGCAILALVLIAELLLSRVVVSRLRRFLRAVKEAGLGNLDARAPVRGRDEIAALSKEFNHMADELQRRDEVLSTLNAVAETVSQSLRLEEVLHGALDEVLGLTGLEAGWITLRGRYGDQAFLRKGPVRPMRVQADASVHSPSESDLTAAIRSFHLAASRGLSKEATRAHAQCNWERCACSEVFESGQAQVFRLRQPHLCLAEEYLHQKGLVCRACVPLRSKDRVLGVMSLAGASSNSVWMFTQGAQDMLSAVGRQIGVAVENASLYEEQRRIEMLRRQLFERGIDLQEEERRRIARELHDQTSQRLTSVLMTLGVLAESKSVEEIRAHVGDLRAKVAQTLEEVHDLALELRPRLLDDLGLVAALRHYLGEFRDRYRIPVDLQVVGLDDRRLPARVETALYRVAQQALINVARHAQAQSVGVLLEDRGPLVVLIVEDDGIGFDVEKVMGSHVLQTNLGLYGMRERASLLGGTLTIESALGGGTSVFVEVPLNREEYVREQDPTVGR